MELCYAPAGDGEIDAQTRRLVQGGDQRPAVAPLDSRVEIALPSCDPRAGVAVRKRRAEFRRCVLPAGHWTQSTLVQSCKT